VCQSLTAGDAKAAEEQTSFTAEDAKVTEENRSFTAENAEDAEDYRYRLQRKAYDVFKTTAVRVCES
jgi:hypothetical protein